MLGDVLWSQRSKHFTRLFVSDPVDLVPLPNSDLTTNPSYLLSTA